MAPSLKMCSPTPDAVLKLFTLGEQPEHKLEAATLLVLSNLLPGSKIVDYHVPERWDLSKPKGIIDFSEGERTILHPFLQYGDQLYNPIAFPKGCPVQYRGKREVSAAITYWKEKGSTMISDPELNLFSYQALELRSSILKKMQLLDAFNPRRVFYRKVTLFAVGCLLVLTLTLLVKIEFG